MRSSYRLLSALFLASLLLSGCGSVPEEDPADMASQLDVQIAAQAPFALSKNDTPILNTYDWDAVFGGEDGKTLKYDRFGEIDELVFVAAPNTFFTLQRQIRRQTRSGTETIYYKVTTPSYKGDQPLWVDGRFLDLRDIRPKVEQESVNPAKTLVTLRTYENKNYTWHGSSTDGVPDLLYYYPPSEDVSLRTKDDWMLKGFNSLGLLYRASEGQTPLDLVSLPRFGEAVYADLDKPVVEETSAAEDEDSSEEAPEGEEADVSSEEEDTPATEEEAESTTEDASAAEDTENTETTEEETPTDTRAERAQRLMALLKPLDIIHMGDRVWIVLDNNQVIESRYVNKFEGKVRISSLLDTAYGLLGKSVFVKDPFQEVTVPGATKFYVRRWVERQDLLPSSSSTPESSASSEEEVE